MEKILENKVVLITGGAKGIGKAIAEELAKLGASIVILDILENEGVNSCFEIEHKFNVPAVFFKCDISNEVQVKQTIGKTLNKFSKIDILINNAAISGKQKNFLDLSANDFKKVIETNLLGSFFCTKYTINNMLNEDKGVIIFIGSGSVYTGLKYFSAYCASKGGLICFAKTIKEELKNKNKHVFWVNPPYVMTDLYREIIGKLINKKEVLAPKQVAYKVSRIIVDSYFPNKKSWLKYGKNRF